MKIKRISAMLTAVVFIITLCLAVISPTADAILSKNGSITIHVADSQTGKPLPSATVRLYFFAAAYEKENSLGYEYVIPYENCSMDMDNLEDAYLPVHLAYFALSNSLPYTEKVSDEYGRMIFEDLVPGVYLVVPVNNVENYLMPSPFVVNIPLFDKKNKNWIYDIDASPKMHMNEWTDNHDSTYISVKKKWDTDGVHPDEITVILLRDLQEYDRVILNESNNWYYKWEELPKNHSWNVVEPDVPEGYKVSYDFSSNSVTIINSKHTPGTEPGTEPQSTTVPGTETTTPEESTTVPGEGTTTPGHSEPTKPGTTVPTQPTTKPEELIDTGQLNWPVPVLSISGLLLFSLGWAMLNFTKKESA